MAKRIILINAILILLIATTHAQEDRYNMTDLHPVSPTAYQFMKYTEMPVSEYAGIPEIAIPLYEINVDEVKIPIRLTYHSQGVRVSEESSWVGLGWDLRMGSIIQTINDRDDYGTDVEGANVKILPDYFPSNGDGSIRFLPLRNLDPIAGMPSVGWSSPYPIIQPMPQQGFAVATNAYIPVNGVFQNQQNGLFATRWYDSEPDFFAASFLDDNLKFVLDFNNPGQLVVLNKTGYVVTKTTNGFSIVTPKGSTYFFEAESVIKNVTNSTNIEGITAPYTIGGDITSNIFFLTKIITRNKKVITFGYATTGSFTSYPSRSQKMQNLTQQGIINEPIPQGGGSYQFANFDVSVRTTLRWHPRLPATAGS